MLPAIIGGIAALGSALLGRNASRQAEDSARLQALTNIQEQKEFAQHGIRWRVEDAKAAGLHPLYALGGGGATFSPNPIVVPSSPDYGALGQNLSRAASALVSPTEREMMAAQLGVAKSTEAKNYAEAAYWSSESAMRRAATVGTQAPAPVVAPGVDIFALPGQANVQGRELFPWSGESSITDKSAKSAWDVYQVGPQTKMLLPSGTSMSDALESISESTLLGAAIVGMNSKYWGAGWMRDAADHFGLPASKFEAALEKADRLLKAGDLALHPREWMKKGRDWMDSRGLQHR